MPRVYLICIDKPSETKCKVEHLKIFLTRDDPVEILRLKDKRGHTKRMTIN